MEHKFNIGDKVKHKTTNDFNMVIVEFDCYWIGDPNAPYNELNNIGNPEYPVCKYYNIRTDKWEKEKFKSCELILVE